MRDDDDNILNVNNKTPFDSNYIIPEISDYNDIPKGDMPGDKIYIKDNHINKAKVIYPRLLELLVPILNEQSNQRAVIAVHGGSGVGKSEIGSLIAYYLNYNKVGAYILSGDNYPRRVPKYNDAERVRIFRESGIKGLVKSGEYSKEKDYILKLLQENENDSNSKLCSACPIWLSIYQEAGRNGLKDYLGTTNEIDFNQLNKIIKQFKNGESKIILKRMGREENEVRYELVDFSSVNVMIIEWTHGNNPNIEGVDIPILLNSTPQETLEHRRLRGRDNKTDSPFTMMVLEIEQKMIFNQAKKARIILTKDGKIITYDEYKELMHNI